MSAADVYDGIVALVEGLTPADTTHGEPGFRFVDGQTGDYVLDRGFVVRRTAQEPSGPVSTTASRYLTTFSVEVFHAPSQSVEDDEKRIAQDVETLIAALRDVAQHDTDYVGAVLQDSITADTDDDEARNYRTVVTLTVNHI